MIFLKVGMLLQFATSCGNNFQSLTVAGKKCLKVYVVQMGSLSYFELLTCVFLVL